MKIRSFTIVLATLSTLTILPAAPAIAAPVTPESVVTHYAKLVHANYVDALEGALALQQAVQDFVTTPNEAGLKKAREAWLAGREWYGTTEAFRFYAGPIDDEEGPEGRLNAWPLDEAYIDYVKGRELAGIVNNPSITINKKELSSLNERGGEENVAAGWHAIEFLLWGQDTSETTGGSRTSEDYIVDKAPNVERRKQYLLTVSEMLVDDLQLLVNEWAPGKQNYRSTFEAEGMESVRKMIVGIGSLSRGELAGERLEVAMDTQDQEDEHSCFSDNTHRDAVTNATGIENVWLGRYHRRDGSILQGPGIKDLVANSNAEIANKVTKQIAKSVGNAKEIQAPFDREILGGNDAPGRKRVQKTIDALVAQSNGMAEAASAIGIKHLKLVEPE